MADLGGKTLFTKGFYALEYDIDEVTSPSFSPVNLYNARFKVYHHIDLWRIENDAEQFAVGLDEILEEENAIVVIEWSERFEKSRFSEERFQSFNQWRWRRTTKNFNPNNLNFGIWNL